MTWEEWPRYDGEVNPYTLTCPDCGEKVRPVKLIFHANLWNNREYFDAVCIRCKRIYYISAEKGKLTISPDTEYIIYLEERLTKLEAMVEVLMQERQTPKTQHSQPERIDTMSTPATNDQEFTKKYAYLLQ